MLSVIILAGNALSALIKGHIKGQMRIKKMKKRKILALNL
ncbi:hypothetical protein AOH416_13650 [Helicobacter pylori]